MQQSSSVKLWANLVIVYVVWGSTFLGVRYAIEVLPPLLTNAIRFLVGGVIFFLFTLLRGYSIPSIKQWLSAAWIGMLLSGVGNCAVAYAIGFMPTGLVALLVATLPGWMVGLDYYFFGKQKPSWLTVVGLGVGLIGMYILLNPGENLAQREIPLFPAFLVFIGSITWAWGSLQSPYLDMPPQMQTTAIQMLGGGVFSLVMSLFLEPNGFKAFDNMTHQTYMALLYLIVMGSFVGYSAYVWLLHHAAPSLTATYAYVNPVVAMILGWLVVNEKLSTRSLVASAVVLTGVVLITFGRRASAKAGNLR
ncbi:EamA family transporter [Runella salmonicolor]|uniref:EamA family transporter n=1 Tax=Runella salmonicolor TaxID=2950278 RepID=A0ABT1FS31_9BACT|nr:EamA family transporter [Runella salmonicolor]MCP1384578.1 EamA family transporter [Runella salmonicolor]